MIPNHTDLKSEDYEILSEDYRKISRGFSFVHTDIASMISLIEKDAR